MIASGPSRRWSSRATRPAAPPADAIVLFDGKDLSQWDRRQPQRHRRRLHQYPQDGPNPHEAEVRRLPAPRRMGHARQGRRRRHELGQQRRLLPRQVRTADHRVARQQDLRRRHRRGDLRPDAAAGERLRGSRASGRPSTSSSPPRDSTATSSRKPAYFTVFWNGVLVQNHTASLGPMRHREVATYDSRETTGPIMLQQHGSAVRFRNIWVRPLKLDEFNNDIPGAYRVSADRPCDCLRRRELAAVPRPGKATAVATPTGLPLAGARPKTSSGRRPFTAAAGRRRSFGASRFG